MKCITKRATILSLMIAPLLFPSVNAAAQDTINRQMLTFEQALTIAMGNSHSIKQAQYLQSEKKQMAKAANGLYMPNVGITANYMVLSEDLHLDLTPVRDAIAPLYHYGVFNGVPNTDPATSSVMPVLNQAYSTHAMNTVGYDNVMSAEWDKMIQKKQFGTVAATMQWPLYAGGKIRAANKAATIESHEAEEIMRQKQGEVLSELVERYYGLCLATQAVTIRKNVYDGMQKHLNDAEKMFQQGLIANADVMHARVYESQANRELTKANRTVDILNDALLNTLAVADGEQFIPASQLFYLDTIEPEVYFAAMAATKNPLLMQVDGKQRLADQNYKATRADYLPSIAVIGMYDIVNKDLSPYAPEWMIGVGLKWTLFDGAARYHKVKAASFKVDQVDEFREKAKADVSTMVQKLYQELSINHEQLVQLETARLFAEEYLRMREKSFHEDMANATEVVDAYLALSQVSIERLQAMYNYDLALARLLQYSGIPEQFIAYSQRPNAITERLK
jgi:outer membrane protein TolC